jgi:hypothetical protein
MTWSAEETDDPNNADARNYYKVERWTNDGLYVAGMLYAGNDLEHARSIFAAGIKRRPRARLTIRQRSKVLWNWPER